MGHPRATNTGIRGSPFVPTFLLLSNFPTLPIKIPAILQDHVLHISDLPSLLPGLTT